MSNTIGGRRSPLPSIAVGVIAAVVGAVLWAVLVEVSGYKVGYAAVGLGLLVGLGMSRTAAAWRPLPVVAAVIALAGCLLGDLFVDTAEAADGAGISTISALAQLPGDPGLVGDVFSAGFEPLDALFWALAAWAAFRMTRKAVQALTEPAAVATAAVATAAVAAAAPASDPTAGFSGQPAPWSTPGTAPQEPTP